MKFKSASQRKAVMAKLRVYKTTPSKKYFDAWDGGRNLKQARDIASYYPKGSIIIVKNKSVSSKLFPYVLFARKTWDSK